MVGSGDGYGTGGPVDRAAVPPCGWSGRHGAEALALREAGDTVGAVMAAAPGADYTHSRERVE